MKKQGNTFYKQEKFEEAAKCYEEAIRLSVGEGEKDSVVATYHQNLAAVYDVLVRSDANLKDICDLYTYMYMCVVWMYMFRVCSIQIKFFGSY